MLYKHNKKFKGFCDGLVKAVKNGIAKVGAMFINGVAKVGKFLGDAGKAVVNFGKTVGKVLIFANPFVLGFALMYKHSKPFRKFIKGLVNGAKSLYKNLLEKLLTESRKASRRSIIKSQNLSETPRRKSVELGASIGTELKIS